MAKTSQIEKLLLAEELALYEPSPKVVQKLGGVVLYAIVAPYGSGKDSVVDWLTSHRPHQFAAVVGDTTRPPREGETDGVSYHFRSKAEMTADLHDSRFVQVVPGFMGNFYATRPEQYPTDKIAIKPIQAREMSKFERLGFKDIKWLQIVPHSYEAWLAWQDSRRYKVQDQIEREEEAIQSYTLSLTNPRVHFVLNDEIVKAAERIIRLAEGRRLTDATRAQQIAVRNLEAQKEHLKEILNPGTKS